MKIYPILNNLGKGKYVFIFILNERAVFMDGLTVPLVSSGLSPVVLW